MKTSDSWPLSTVALLGGISILPSTSIFSVTFDATAEKCKISSSASNNAMKSYVYIDTQIRISISGRWRQQISLKQWYPSTRWHHIPATIKSHDMNQTVTFFTVCVLQFSLNYLLLLLVLLVLSTCNYIRHHRINQRQTFHQALFCSVLKDDKLTSWDFKKDFLKNLNILPDNKELLILYINTI